MLYGIQIAAGTLTNNSEKSFTFFQQIFFYGFLFFIPIAPLLAASAFIQSTTALQQRLACWFLAGSCIFIVAALLVWGMRSVAMIAVLLPLALLSYTGKVDWRKMVLPALGLMVLVYGVVTFVRISSFRSLLSQTSNLTELSMDNVASAVMKPREDSKGVGNLALYDMSYRTAGLEAPAAFIQAQAEGRLSWQWGKTVQAGFLQALPAWLRPVFTIPECIKSAPLNLGIFRPGDWVTTLLSEFVFDFGPFFLFFPAVIAGFGLGFIDQTLLGLGQRRVLDGLLIVRFAFFLFIILIGSGISDMTLLFFKATFGYIVFFILLGNLLRFSFAVAKEKYRVKSHLI
jgi:hypothetical protein